MKRHEWKFYRTGKELAAAALAKKEHHAARHQWWKDKLNQLVAEVREKGMEVDLPITMQADYAKKSMAGAQFANTRHVARPQIVITNDYQDKLDEAAAKLQEHQTQVPVYDGWVQVLQSNAESTYELNHDDYLFFYGV